MSEDEGATRSTGNHPPWNTLPPGCLIAFAVLVVLPGGCVLLMAADFSYAPDWQLWAIGVGTIALVKLLLVGAARGRDERVGIWKGWWRVREPGVLLRDGPAGAETGRRVDAGTQVLVRRVQGEYLKVRIGRGPLSGWVHQNSVSRD